MAERPILMSGPMVRAILNGRKTETRRVVRPQPPDVGEIVVGPYNPRKVDRAGEEYPGEEIYGAYDYDGQWGCRCPYGQPGELLYVRETWGTRRMHELGQHIFGDGPIPDFDQVVYRAGRLVHSSEDAPANFDFAKWPTRWTDDPAPNSGRWRPSIHMPKWAARIWLEVTDVRVERVGEITEADAEAEGAPMWVMGHGPISDGDLGVEPGYWSPQLYRNGFMHLWDELNAKSGFGWDTNPWVWALSFRRTETPDG